MRRQTCRLYDLAGPEGHLVGIVRENETIAVNTNRQDALASWIRCREGCEPSRQEGGEPPRLLEPIYKSTLVYLATGQDLEDLMY